MRVLKGVSKKHSCNLWQFVLMFDIMDFPSISKRVFPVYFSAFLKKSEKGLVAVTTLAFFFASFVFYELLFTAFVRGFGKNSLKVLLLCLAASYVFALFCAAIPVPAAYAVIIIILLPATLLMMAQIVYYGVFSNFFTFFSAANGGKVIQFMSVIINTILRNAYYLLLLCLPLTVFIIWGRRILNSQLPFSSIQATVLGLFMLSCLLAFFYGIAKAPLSRYSISMGLGDACRPIAHIGLWGAMITDALSNLPQKKLPLLDTLHIPIVRDPGRFTPETHQILPINFEMLVNKAENDPALEQLHEYFASRRPSCKNDHTGRFSGYNIIYITAESFSHLAIRPDLTPTLYKFQQKGIRFKNCYNPLWGVSTIDGEYVSSTGLLPKAGIWSQLKAQRHAMPFTLANRLSPLGYQAFAYHNNYYDYYRRDLTHPNMGYRYKGLHGGENGGLKLENVWPQSDLELAQHTFAEYINAQPFVAYYMTVSGHLPYSFKSNAQSNRHRDSVAHLPYSEPVLAYLATQIELENMLAYLLAELEAAGASKRTVIALVSDHFPYGLSLRHLSELAGHPVEPQFEKQRNAMLLYAPGMTPEKVDNPVYSADMLPTLLNLLGAPFDSRLLSGRDIFGDTPPLVPFTDRSFIVPEGRYNSKTKTFSPAKNAPEPPPETLRQWQDDVNARFAAAARILETDYYALLEKHGGI